ncbi:hypothetical protein [Cryobacterium arcticum]|uniref:Uncharacterized protein n=1 Tax=Cryobacterium arcticum TaxID=670052 RepID=A0A1B1BPN6_9MICO|nr:hypothetical protein [Cryobacterium arcticum]ANP74496.1 hypothetical protein PA27867_3574 [Cryobacterium arcticum]
MAAFNKSIVLGGVRDELTRATQNADNKFDIELAAWNTARQESKAAVKQAKATLAKVIAAGDDLAAVLNAVAPLRNDYNGYRDSRFEAQLKAAAAAPSLVPPQRKRSARERALEHVIAIVESADGETISLTDLRGFGVMEFVKYNADNCN